MKRVLVAVVVVAIGGAAATAVAFRWKNPAPGTESGVLEGLCEASAIVEYEGGFLVGDNEGERQLYRFGPDFSPQGIVELPSKVEDIEALAPTPGGLLVVGSHSRNKKGKRKKNREVVLNLETGKTMRVDFSGCARCMGSEGLAPKKGGINIEGAAWWRSSLWLGMRSPLDGGSAHLFRMEKSDTETLVIAETVALELGGLGIRDLRTHGDELWILSGPTGSGRGNQALFRLSAPDQPLSPVDVQLPHSTEGMAWTESGNLIVVTDGDGKPGDACAENATWAQIP